jgi:hypothetical protein
MLDYQSKSETGKQFLGPSVSIGLGILESLSIGLLYQNRLIQQTPPKLWKTNPYIDTLYYRHNYERVKNKTGFVLRFYPTRMMNVELNVSRFEHVRKIMFEPASTNIGYFSVLRLDTKVLEVNFLSNLSFGKFGDVFSEIKYIDSKISKNSKVEPFTPLIQVNAIYTFKFDFSLLLRLRFLYNSISYSDINNVSQIGDYLDLGMNVEYEIGKYLKTGVEISNILNRRNYRWKNYQLEPIDVLFYLSTNL